MKGEMNRKCTKNVLITKISMLITQSSMLATHNRLLITQESMLIPQRGKHCGFYIKPLVLPIAQSVFGQWRIYVAEEVFP